MHEIAVLTKERDSTLPKYRDFRPVGSIVSAISDHRKLAKWLEIICVLASPKRRDRLRYDLITNNGWSGETWDEICTNWTPQLWQKWREFDLIPSASSVEMANKIVSANQLWNEYISTISGFISALGKDPENKVDIVDTWLWTKNDRKNMFIIVNDDSTYSEIAEMETKTKDESGDIPIYKPAKVIDWVNDLGLSKKSKDDILDPTKIKNPRFDKVLKKEKIKNHSNPTSISGIKAK